MEKGNISKLVDDKKYILKRRIFGHCIIILGRKGMVVEIPVQVTAGIITPFVDKFGGAKWLIDEMDIVR